MPNQLQSLRFAAGQRVQWLSEPQIGEPDFFQNLKRLRQTLSLADLREKLNGLSDGHLENVVNRFVLHLDLQHVRLKTPAFAFGAADVEIAQELHLDLFEAGAAAALATAAPGIERERARGQALRHRFRLRGKKFAHAIVETEIKDRGRSRRAREGRLIHHHDIADPMRARDRFACARLLIGRLFLCAREMAIQNVMDQR